MFSKLNKLDLLPILLWLTIIYITYTFMHGVDHFLELTPQALGKYYPYKWVIIVHITTGGGALIFGFVQFSKKLRTYSWKLHRIIGFVYLLSILLSSFCALFLSFTTAYHVNFPYAFSLHIWASVWISSTALAYYFVLQRKINLHHQWMVRSYLVTLAFVISGLLLKFDFVLQMGSFEEISPSLFWLGWSVPLYVYEIYLSSIKRRV